MATSAKTTKKSPARKAPAKSTTVKSMPARASKLTFAGHIQQSVRSVSLWRALAAELIGTFLLASAVITGQGQPIIVLFALVGIVLMIGTISGAYVNPAITIGALVTRRIGWLRAVGYIIAQVLGAILAFVTFNAFLGSTTSSDAAQLYQQTPTLFQAADLAAVAGKEWFVFFAEVLGAAILAFAVANATRERQDRVAAAFTVGLGIFIALMVAVTAASYAGASAIINPALAVTLQAVSWNLWPIAVYILAPVIGGVAGFVLYDLIRGRDNN
jgi:aquaporin Z